MTKKLPVWPVALRLGATQTLSPYYSSSYPNLAFVALPTNNAGFMDWSTKPKHVLSAGAQKPPY